MAPAARPSSNVEGQGKKLVMQDGGNRQNRAAEHGPAGADQQTEKNDGFKRNVGGEKVGNPEAKPNPDRERHQEKCKQRQGLPATALFGKKQATESGYARQHAGHRGHHAQLDQQRDPDKVVRHPITVPRRAALRRT